MTRLTILLLCCVSLFVQTAGTIQTVAGNGSEAYSGDGGPATQAVLNVPVEVFADRKGNLFVADQDNNRIRKIAPGGSISTVAGTDVAGFSGDGGPAVDAQLNTPTGVFGDTGAPSGSQDLVLTGGGSSKVVKIQVQ